MRKKLKKLKFAKMFYFQCKRFLPKIIEPDAYTGNNNRKGG
jgi:hypothetical protein